MKPLLHIDINADLGEGIGNEAKIMPYLSSCNVACGGHAGDSLSMTNAVRFARACNVKIGTHPSFPDKVNFGRVEMVMTPTELFTSLKQQINYLQEILKLEGGKLHHIKPHGALYNLAAKDVAIASVIIEVVKSVAQPLKLYAPSESLIAKLAIKNNIEVVIEAFADRNYNDDLSLVSRQNTNAVLTDKNKVLDRVLGVVKHKKITTVNGVEVRLNAHTICVHSDTENAVEILKYLSVELPKNNILIQ